MSQAWSERAKGKKPFLLLILALTALVAWTSGVAVPSGARLQQAEVSQPDRLLPAGFAHIAPVDAPDQDELETLSEQLQDPLLALGHQLLALDASAEAEQTTHGSVRGWAVCAAIFRSSSARGPPLS